MSKSKQPEDQSKTTEQGSSSAKPAAPTETSQWPLPKGCWVVGDGESHIFIGGFPCAPSKKLK